MPTTDDDVDADELTGIRAIRLLADEVLADLAPIRRMWATALQGRAPIPPAPGHTAFTPRALGTGFHRRIELLAELDPVPDSIPEPPPWRRFSLWGVRRYRLDDERDDVAPSAEQLIEWESAAPTRQAAAQVEYERTGFSAVHRLDPMAPGSSGPVPPTVIVELDALTDLALVQLVRPLYADGSIPVAHRFPSPGAEVGPVDLLAPNTIVEVKLATKETFQKDWAVQVLRYLLWDATDKFSTTHLAFYEGRRGALVRIPVTDLVRGGAVGLHEARQQSRQILATKPQQSWGGATLGRPVWTFHPRTRPRRAQPPRRG